MVLKSLYAAQTDRSRKQQLQVALAVVARHSRMFNCQGRPGARCAGLVRRPTGPVRVVPPEEYHGTSQQYRANAVASPYDTTWPRASLTPKWVADYAPLHMKWSKLHPSLWPTSICAA